MTALPRAGYTLPVFACAAAIAALQRLLGQSAATSVTLDLLEPPQPATIALEQVALLSADSALAIARSDPGDNLDLTRDTPVWAWVRWGASDQPEAIALAGGEGIGRQDQGQGPAAIYQYAQRLLRHNLAAYLPGDRKLQVTIILPEGQALATRTSNAAFGVVEGLSLLGTTGISQPLSAPGQLDAYRAELTQKAQGSDTLVFCVGENGLDLARQLGVPEARLVKTANWIGPLLVEAGLLGVTSLLLFGYHGKLIKLAGGIFHTHHHVADGRQEILTAIAGAQGLPTEVLATLLDSPTVESALQSLRQLDAQRQTAWTAQIYGAIAQQIDARAQRYIQHHSDRAVAVGSLLFDRQRQIIVTSDFGEKCLAKLC